MSPPAKPNPLLRALEPFAVSSDGSLIGEGDGKLAGAARKAIEKQNAVQVVSTVNGSALDSVLLAVPTFCEGKIVSVTVFERMPCKKSVGVFEIWSPVGSHEEVALTDGYYGSLERFQNVSSFIRFEIGSGLPGIVWKDRRPIIHDDLPNHPGFLRGAGASVESLNTAVGLPVGDRDCKSVVVLMSSETSPLAYAFQVFQRTERGFEHCQTTSLTQSSTTNFSLMSDQGIVGLCAVERRAVKSSDPALIRTQWPTEIESLPVAQATGLPIFSGADLTYVLVLFT